MEKESYYYDKYSNKNFNITSKNEFLFKIFKI